MKNRQIYHNSRIFLIGLLLSGIFSGCIRDSLSDCPTGVPIRVMVAVDAARPEGGIGEDACENVMLYVFDDRGILLESIPTEVGRTEYLNYSGTRKFYAVAVANLNGSVSLSDLVPGQTNLSEGTMSLLADVLEGEGSDFHTVPDDLFFGNLEIPNNPSAEVTELPVKRIVAGVVIRVKGMRESLNQPNAPCEDFHVVLGGLYNSVDFYGTPSYRKATRRVTEPVKHKFTGDFHHCDGADYFEVPVQTDPDTKTDFTRVLSTDEGSPVSVGLYYRGNMITELPISTDRDGEPLNIRNRVLNVITIDLTGRITVKIEQTAWGSRVEIEKEYGGK